MIDKNSPLDLLVETILKSSKYCDISEDLVRRIGTHELSKYRSTRQAIKSTKSKLHQVAGAYFETKVDYVKSINELEQAADTNNKETFRDVCQKVMSQHASTKERVKILDEFYTTTLSEIQPINTVLDIACGLNPLTIPWMPLSRNAKYYAYDIYTDMIKFLQEFMGIAGIAGKAEVRDVIQFPPTQRADLALILKAIPCLEQLNKTAGYRLLDTINADHLLVSFPVHSLSGRNKGMITNYENRFRRLIQDRPWHIQRFEFATELVFLVTKG